MCLKEFFVEKRFSLFLSECILRLNRDYPASKKR